MKSQIIFIYIYISHLRALDPGGGREGGLLMLQMGSIED